jgi:hypothetical protein
MLKKAWNKVKDSAKKTVKKALSGVQDNNVKAPTPDATLGPSGDTKTRATQRMDADRRRRRGARGRDSTIITAGSSIGSRTLLG